MQHRNQGYTGGPDDFNFEFVERFCNLLKEYVIMLIMGEIHRSGGHFCRVFSLQRCCDPECKLQLCLELGERKRQGKIIKRAIRGKDKENWRKSWNIFFFPEIFPSFSLGNKQGKEIF